jgi:hypothetical protein
MLPSSLLRYIVVAWQAQTKTDHPDALALHQWLLCNAYNAVQVERVSRQVHRLERGLPPNSLVPRLRDSVAQWQVGTSLLCLLGSQGFESRRFPADMHHSARTVYATAWVTFCCSFSCWQKSLHSFTVL